MPSWRLWNLCLMFIMPALTSASISGERERHTLELMFTTKIRPVDIVIGKLASAFTHLMILVFSSLPVLMLTFIYGSISSQDLFLLLFSYVTVALYCGSLGIFASSLMKRSTFSNVITYGIMLVLVVGTYMLNVFLLRISETEINMMVRGRRSLSRLPGRPSICCSRIRRSRSRRSWKARLREAEETLRSGTFSEVRLGI